MPVVYRGHGDEGSQENCLFQGIKPCFKTFGSIVDQRLSSEWQQNMNQMSAGSLPQLQWECWSMDRMCIHQGIWEHALSPPSPSKRQSCCPGMAGAFPDTEVRKGCALGKMWHSEGLPQHPGHHPPSCPHPKGQPCSTASLEDVPTRREHFPHPHAQHKTLTGSAASPGLGQEEEKAARAPQGNLEQDLKVFLLPFLQVFHWCELQHPAQAREVGE